MSMIYFYDYMWCTIHTFSKDLNEGRDVADDVFTGALFQSQIDDGKKEGRYVSVREWEIWSFVVYINKKLGSQSNVSDPVPGVEY